MAADIEALVQEFLQIEFPAARAVTELPSKLTAALPVHRVHWLGGVRTRNLSAARLTIETFAADRESARAAATAVMDAMTLRLPGLTMSDGYVTEVTCNSLPQTIPYSNPAVRACTTAFDVHVRDAA